MLEGDIKTHFEIWAVQVGPGPSAAGKFPAFFVEQKQKVLTKYQELSKNK